MTAQCTACLPFVASSAALLAGFTGLLLVAAVKDVRTMTIPNGISLAMAALYPLHVAVSGADWIGGVMAGGSVLAIGMLLFSLRLLGGGDVKLLAATSLWAGTALVLPALFVTATAGGLLCLVIWVRSGGPLRILRRLSGDAGRWSGRNPSLIVSGPAESAAVVPYAVAILAGGAFVAAVQMLPVLRLAETTL